MNFNVGDMLVIDAPPPKLLKALGVIAAGLHQSFAKQPEIAPTISYRAACRAR
jgi:hypothetical protein